MRCRERVQYQKALSQSYVIHRIAIMNNNGISGTEFFSSILIPTSGPNVFVAVERSINIHDHCQGA